MFRIVLKERWPRFLALVRGTYRAGELMMKTIARVVTSLLAAAMAVPPVARAQSDEIQVYDGGLAPTGVFNLTWHNNYTPDGVKTCLLYTSDAADERSSVDLGGRRI